MLWLIDLVSHKYLLRLLSIGIVVPRTANKLGEWIFSFFTVNFFETSISISRSFQIWSQFYQIKGCKICLKILLLSFSLTNWGKKLAQLFRDFKPCEKIKYKAQFGKCTLQCYTFKIYLSRTDISMIDNEFAKGVRIFIKWKSYWKL